MQIRRFFHSSSFRLVLVGLLLVGGSALAITQIALARPVAAPVEQISPLHPTFMLLDENGLNVLESGGAISTMQTCGQCHNSDFIAEHSFHADAGLEDFTSAGTIAALQPWDSSPGYFGKWDPLTYRYLSASEDELIDLSTPAWIMLYGSRHVGGGPAQYSRDGKLLTELTVTSGDPETQPILMRMKSDIVPVLEEVADGNLDHTITIRDRDELGKLAEAERALADNERLGSGDLTAWRAYLRARAGQVEMARELLDREGATRADRPLTMARIVALAAMGYTDRAFEALEDAVARHAPAVIWLKVTPELAPLRGDPRFAALLERMNRP